MSACTDMKLKCLESFSQKGIFLSYIVRKRWIFAMLVSLIVVVNFVVHKGINMYYKENNRYLANVNQHINGLEYGYAEKIVLSVDRTPKKSLIDIIKPERNK